MILREFDDDDGINIYTYIEKCIIKHNSNAHAKRNFSMLDALVSHTLIYIIYIYIYIWLM